MDSKTTFKSLIVSIYKAIGRKPVSNLEIETPIPLLFAGHNIILIFERGKKKLVRRSS